MVMPMVTSSCEPLIPWEEKLLYSVWARLCGQGERASLFAGRHYGIPFILRLFLQFYVNVSLGVGMIHLYL